MGQTEGLKKYRNLRKDRARMLTVLNEKGTDSNRTVPQVKAADTAGKSKKKK
jgi:hypothetical protein